MIRLNSFAMLKAAFTIRNISSTPYLCRIKPKVTNNIVFINELNETNQLQIAFAVKHENQSRRVGFKRPMSCTVMHSFKRMAQKLQREILTKDDFVLTLSDPNDATVEYTSHTWESLLPALPTLRFQVNDQDFEIAYNYPVIKGVDLPKCATIGLDLYPDKIDFNGDLANCRFQWFRKVGNGKWQQCDNNTQIYRCSRNDWGAMLKLKCHVYYNGIITSSAESNVSHCYEEVSSPVLDTRLQHTEKPATDPQFRVVSYNLLADFYASSTYSKEKLFYYCEAQYLNWAYRERILQKEIFGYNGDIYCLQEVDKNFYQKTLRPSLPFRGMELVYERKEATQEGLAILYNNDKLRYDFYVLSFLII